MKLVEYGTIRVPSYEPAVKKMKRVIERYNDFIVDYTITNDKESVLVMFKILRDLDFSPNDIYITTFSFSDFVLATEDEMTDFVRNILEGKLRTDKGQKSRD